MKPQSLRQGENTIGLSFAVELHERYCSTSLDELFDFLTQVLHVEQALHSMGMGLSDAQSIQGDVQVFGLVDANSTGDPAATQKSEAGEKINLPVVPAVSVVLACLESTGAKSPEALSPTFNADNETRSTYDAAARIGDLDMDRIRNRVAGGPDLVWIDGRPTPWSRNLPKPANGTPRSAPQPVAIEPVCNEIHLISSGNRRYHPEDAADALAVEPGSTVIVEACTTEQMLFAGSDVLVFQPELELPYGDLTS